MTTISAPTTDAAWPNPVCAPRTLEDALLYLAGLWPGAFAAPARLAQFYRHAAEVYAAVTDTKPGMKVRAAAYTDNARQRAEYYAGHTAAPPAADAPRPGVPAWSMLPCPRTSQEPARRTARCAR